eukprot:CAMPEP_0168583322 /NCGR_PEP_ID=MMETSP0420-20121227/2499_1 /TAXON_ID=498008 /ORGANISM="Pessonella sp." /LENGTH=915 /DNA_ID=CAMNT_0008617959 /DNA_START=61 /DNA_END=2805 /DNA_ORIENTATION=-
MDGSKIIERGVGVVKAVPSGDTVIVTQHGVATNGPPPEREISFSGVRAPRVGREGFGTQQANEDKPFAWQAREFLRKQCIGKKVSFAIEHITPTSNRAYGHVSLNDGVSLIQECVGAGWLEVVAPTGNREPSEDTKQLLALQTDAQNNKLGRFTGAGGAALKSVRPLHTNVDIFAVYEKLRDQELTAVVQEIRSGSTVRVVLPENDFLPLQVQLSGVMTPGYRRAASGQYEPEPYAREAKFFLEQAILNRDVTLTLYSIDKNGVFGTLSYAGRDVGLELLKAGLAWYVGWTGQRAPLSEQYQTVAKDAQSKRLRYWSTVQKSQPAANGHASADNARKELPQQFTARVVEIVNATSLRVEYQGQQHAVSLASLRGVQAGRRFRRNETPESNDDDNDAKKAPQESKEDKYKAHVAKQAKEFLRKRLIGQKVQVRCDYTRSGREELPDKSFYTVLHKKQNVAVPLAEHGYVTVVEHSGSDDRSLDYDALLAGEARAKKGKKGVFSANKNVSNRKVLDLTTPDAQLGDTARANKRVNLRKYSDQFQRKGDVVGVVEWVVNPSKVKVFVPKENLLVMVQLAGIRTPRATDTNEWPDAATVAERALTTTKSLALQRDCRVTVTGVQERGGSLLGTVYVNQTDVAETLLDKGLAYVAGRDVPRETEYRTSENHAQLARKGLWQRYDPNAKQEKQAEEKPRRQEVLDVVVTEIVDGNSLYVQAIGEGTQALERMMGALRQENVGAAAPATVRKGDLLLGQFTVDDTWYRARVEDVLDDNRFAVRYVDYGNAEVLPRSRLRPLPASGRYSAVALPFQAQSAKLAFLRAPALEDEFGTDAAARLRDLAFGKKLVAGVEARRDGVLFISLGDPASQIHVNAAMLAAGLSVLQPRRERCAPVPPTLLTKLEGEQAAAKSKRLNTWRY